MKKKIIYGITTVLAISLLTGCGAAKLKNGEELVAKVDNYKISADDLYSEMKGKYAVKTLIDNIDHQLLDTTYKTDETETKAIENQIEEIKKTYGSNDQIFEQIIKQVYNVESVDELKAMLSLDYKRDLAIKDYVKEKVVTDEEVTTYYDTKVIGDVKASHILIKPNAKDSDSEETKTKKENEAKKKAEEIIKKLDNGEDFAKLAKKYSDDKGTASKGGNLGYFNMDDDFEENFVSAAAALKKGAYSKEPVKTKYGYEIILKVDEKDKKKKGQKAGGQTVACPKDVKAWVNRPEDYLWTVDNNIVTVFPVAYQDLYEMIKSTLKVLHAGVTVAELKGKDCIPDHSLAMSTRRCEDCFPVANLTYEQAIAYLRKEAVVLDAGVPRGYVLVAYQDVPLGFVKNIGNRANNLYPQEWRIRSGYLPENLKMVF